MTPDVEAVLEKQGWDLDVEPVREEPEYAESAHIYADSRWTCVSGRHRAGRRVGAYIRRLALAGGH